MPDYPKDDAEEWARVAREQRRHVDDPPPGERDRANPPEKREREGE